MNSLLSDSIQNQNQNQVSKQDQFYQITSKQLIKAKIYHTPLWKKIIFSDVFQKMILLVMVLAVWQIVALLVHRYIHNGHLLFPTVNDTFSEMVQLFTSIDFWKKIGLTLAILGVCALIGIVFGFIFSALSIANRLAYNLLELLASPMSSLPAVALISAAILAFSSNLSSVIFVVSNAVFWTVLASTHAGFTHVSLILKRVGQNYGLSPLKLVRYVLFPAALPAILMGIRLGISRAFQAFVAVELVIGSVYGNGALGFFIAEAKNNYQPPLVYAGLFTIMIMSYILDSQLFGFIERKTIIKWGMKN